MTGPPPLGDMPLQEFHEQLQAAVGWMVEYLGEVEGRPVLPVVEPGTVRDALSSSPPVVGEEMAVILRDFQDRIVPAVTHWNHPGFLAYFAISGSAPGILGEMLAATLNVNAMLWRTSPAATELEEVVCSWMLELLGLPTGFLGIIQDTASSSSLTALTGARSRTFPESVDRGLFGLPRGRVYASREAHSSIHKAVMSLGLGREGLRAVPVDHEYRMDPAALREAIEGDLAEGIRPVAVVATLGTTSSASCDPLEAIVPISREYGLWLHVDAAYGGAAAMLPEMAAHFAGWGEADSIVVNPHKWLFTPVDCSLLFLRDPRWVRDALSVTPEYLRSEAGTGVLNLMEYGVALGRRFRALKLWFVLRYFGVEGLQARLREHIRLARRLADRIRDTDGWEVPAPAHFSTVVVRWSPGGRTSQEQDALNLRLMEWVNAQGDVFISHTRLDPGICLRVAVGNIRTEWKQVERTWDLLLEGAHLLEGESPTANGHSGA